MTEEEYSLLLNMPERTKVVEKSEEFQNVIKNFYATIQEYHSKIKIIQVKKYELHVFRRNVLCLLCMYICLITLRFPPGGETDESPAVQSVQVEAGKLNAAWQFIRS